MAEDFTSHGYRALIEELRARGYQARGYSDADPTATHVILRHDVDISLQAATAMAAIEYDLRVGAHYFVLLRTEMYNPYSAAGRDAIRRIVDLGHRVGLHLDASLYGNDTAALDAAAGTECDILEKIAGVPVEMISFHRPSRAMLVGHTGRLAGRRHAYEPSFFVEIGYCSDSRGAWHRGHPLSHPTVAGGGALQLLTHPIWWVGDIPLPAQDRLERFATQRDAFMRAELGRQCEAFDPGRRHTPSTGAP